MQDALAESQADKKTSGELVLAIDEMCSNLIIHGHACNAEHLIEIVVDTDQSNRIIFEIVDDSKTFDINRFSMPDLNELIHEKRKGGLGIRLVRSIMDEVEYFSRNGRNICRLVKIIR